jgi:hypothetical protein
MWGRSERYNIFAGEGVESDLAAVPDGHLAYSAWVLPLKPGGMSSTNEAVGISGLTAFGAMGVNAETLIEGLSSFSGIGELVVSAIAVIAGTSSLSGNVIAALQAAANLAGLSSAIGSLAALGHAIATLEGFASSTIVIRATGQLDAHIEIGATGTLTASAIADEILDASMVETGLSVRETLRLCVAALAGKIAGANGSTITIRNAVADDTDRIVATVDVNGNRTAITYDLD